MNNFVTASFQWSIEETLKHHRVVLLNSENGRGIRRSQWTVGLVSAFGIIGCLIDMAHQGPNRKAISILMFLCFLGGMTLMMNSLGRRYLIKHYKRQSNRDMKVTWEFYSDHIVVTTDLSSAILQWGVFSRVLQTKEGFLIFKGDLFSEWLPAHAFHDPAETEAFIQLAKVKILQFEQKN